LADAPFVDERASDPTSVGEFNDFGLAHRTLAESLAERGGSSASRKVSS
jgi:hypothetical protein